MKLVKGDTVMIIAGKDRGKKGTIEKVLPKANTVVVSEINIVKRHVKPNRKYPSGGIVETAYPIHQSNVMRIDSTTDKPTRKNTAQATKKKAK